MRLGVTGHQEVSKTVIRELERTLQLFDADDQLVLVGSLAEGADQSAARAVLTLGGQLEVIVPCDGYEGTFSDCASQLEYARLLGMADRVTVLPYPRPDESAYMAAGILVVERCARLLAVWDGKPAKGLGGTADVVQYARDEGRDIQIIWPAGATRR